MSSLIKTYVGIIRDHSASMRGLTSSAAKDYNSLIASIKEGVLTLNQNIIINVVECGYGNTDLPKTVINNATVHALEQINSYIADGRGTPLFDSVGMLIDAFENMPDANDPNTSFLILAITDGEENASRKWGARSLGQKIRQLNSLDRWTFTFRVPRGGARGLINSLGLYQGNVIEWEQTDRGMQQATAATTSAITSYFTARSTGVTSVKSFYADLKDVKLEDVKAQLVDISAQVTSWLVQTEAEGKSIREFVEHKLGTSMLKGGAFYKLVAKKKTADKVQDHKLIMIRDKNTKVIYSGQAARDLLGLPKYGDAKVRPGSLGDWEVFIQSTSVNRVLPVGTEVLYWPNVGKAFKS